MDASSELSTKILEYGAAGCPVVLNRSRLHVSLLGADYPLLAGGLDEAREAILRVSAEPEARAEAQRRCRELSERHTFSRVAASLAVPLGVDGRSAGQGGEEPAGTGSILTGPSPAPPPIRNPSGSPRLLLAGHEFRFFTDIADRVVNLGAALREDRWAKHVVHDEQQSLDGLRWGEAIHCEWCLGAAIYYSQRRSDAQRLTVRFHRMELETPYPAEVQLDRVHTMVFVAQHVLEQACSQYGWSAQNPCFRVIPNMIDAESLTAPKLPDAEFTLGLVGWVPMLKRVDRALQVLERLRAHDERFRLVIKGKGPWDYYWMATRPEERRFYESALARIERSPLLRGAVIFEQYGEEMAVFLQKIGWILSVSEIEGHGVAPAEGMASGAVPVVIDRPGAFQQYARDWVHSDPDAAAASILAVVSRDAVAAEGERAREWAQQWSREALLPVWDEVLGLAANDQA
jgi:glycosyltransferase involved in cell wall biosynthesis